MIVVGTGSNIFLANTRELNLRCVSPALMQVKYLQIAKKSGTYNPYRWVRYVTLSNSYVARMWCGKSFACALPFFVIFRWFWLHSNWIIVLLLIHFHYVPCSHVLLSTNLLHSVHLFFWFVRHFWRFFRNRIVEFLHVLLPNLQATPPGLLLKVNGFLCHASPGPAKGQGAQWAQIFFFYTFYITKIIIYFVTQVFFKKTAKEGKKKKKKLFKSILVVVVLRAF